jgi:hypothetical protein
MSSGDSDHFPPSEEATITGDTGAAGVVETVGIAGDTAPRLSASRGFDGTMSPKTDSVSWLLVFGTGCFREDTTSVDELD